MANLMRIHYIAGINSDRVQVTIENQEEKVFSQEYAFGYNASSSKKMQSILVKTMKMLSNMAGKLHILSSLSLEIYLMSWKKIFKSANKVLFLLGTMYSLEMILIQRMNDFLISSSKSFFDF